jgi:hypothetical protein
MPVANKYKKYKGDSQDVFPRVNNRKFREKRRFTFGGGASKVRLPLALGFQLRIPLGF